jgi:hypothetical protein
MSDESVRVQIDEGDGPAPAKGETDKAAIERANAQAERARQEIAQAHAIIEQNQQHQLLIGLSLAKAESANAKAAYREAMETGDFDKASEAQEQIATAAVRIQQLEAYAAQPQRPQQPSDPVEAFARGRTEATAAWVKSHPDYITDPRKFAKLQSGHYSALAEGLTPDTPEYFARVEKEIGLRKGENRQQTKRTGDDNHGVRGSEVHLTPGEAAAATNGAVVWNQADVKARRCRPDQVGEPIGLVLTRNARPPWFERAIMIESTVSRSRQNDQTRPWQLCGPENSVHRVQHDFFGGPPGRPGGASSPRLSCRAIESPDAAP